MIKVFISILVCGILGLLFIATFMQSALGDLSGWWAVATAGAALVGIIWAVLTVYDYINEPVAVGRSRQTGRESSED